MICEKAQNISDSSLKGNNSKYLPIMTKKSFISVINSRLNHRSIPSPAVKLAHQIGNKIKTVKAIVEAKMVRLQVAAQRQKVVIKTSWTE